MSGAIVFAMKNWKLLIGALGMAVLGFMLMTARADARHWKKLDEQHVAQRDLEVAKHAVTRQSLDQAIAIIADKNAESEARGRALAAAQAQDAKQTAAADQRQRADAGRIAALRSIANAPASGCKAPDILIRNLEGL